jgi:hypothetical protein
LKDFPLILISFDKSSPAQPRNHHKLQCFVVLRDLVPNINMSKFGNGLCDNVIVFRPMALATGPGVLSSRVTAPMPGEPKRKGAKCAFALSLPVLCAFLLPDAAVDRLVPLLRENYAVCQALPLVDFNPSLKVKLLSL